MTFCRQCPPDYREGFDGESQILLPFNAVEGEDGRIVYYSAWGNP